jgi:hypothetical protein
MAKKSKSSRYGKARNKGKRTPTNRTSKNIYGTKVKVDDKPLKFNPFNAKELEEITKELSKMPSDTLSCFLVDDAVKLGWKINLDYILEEELTELNSLYKEDKVSIKKDMELYWRKLLCPYINKMFDRNRSRVDEIKQDISKNILFVEGLERKQSTLNIPDMLGVFATKKYKKGDKLTNYPVHYLVVPVWDTGAAVPFEEEYKPPTRAGMWFDDTLFNAREVEDAFSKGVIDATIKYTAGYFPYALDLAGVGAVYGDPRPALNQNSKYWGHLINDGIYRQGITEKEYNTHTGQDINHNCKWDGLDIVAIKDIDCDEELFLGYGAKYWFGGTPKSRDYDICNGISHKYSDNLLPINKNANPVVPINPKKGIYGKISDMKEEFLLKNQTKEGYEMIMSMMKTVASHCE